MDRDPASGKPSCASWIVDASSWTFEPMAARLTFLELRSHQRARGRAFPRCLAAGRSLARWLEPCCIVSVRSFWLLLLATACQPFGIAEEDQAVSKDATSAGTPAPAPASTSSSPATVPAKTPALPATGGPCSGALFCDDFEAGPKGNGLWEGFEAINGDALVRTSPSAGSGSFSLGFIVSPGSQTTHSALRHDLGVLGHVELSFAIRVPMSFGLSGGHVNLAHLDFGEDAELVLAVVGEGNRIGLSTLDEIRTFDSVGDATASAGKWHTVKLVVDLPGTPATSRLSIDGVDVVTGDPLMVDFAGAPPVRLVVGPDYSTTGSAFEVRYDNVRIDGH